MSAKVKISVLIPTENRANLLGRCLKSLIDEQSDLFSYEFILGIQSDDFDSAELINRLLKNNKSKVKSFKNKITPAQLRNELIPECTGDFVYFIDDDAYVVKDFFSKFSNHLVQGRPDVIGGPNLTPPNSGFWTRVVGYTLQSRFATLFSSSRYIKRGSVRNSDESSLILCNLFVRRELLSNKSFLPELECGEENYLLQNLKNKKAKILYDPDLFVYHERRSDLLSFARQVFKYGMGRGQLARIGFKRIHWTHLIPFIALLYVVFYLCAVLLQIESWIHIPVILYLTTIIFASLKLGFTNKQDFFAALTSGIVFPIVHFSYALGTLRGLLRGYK